MPKKRLLSWEREMPKPPKSSEVVRDIILSHIRFYEPRPIPLIHECVLGDYGQVTRRTVYRHIKMLLEAGLVIKIRDDIEDLEGYVRAVPPRWSREQQVWV
jgi:DNA-binding transcriptional ArsR family regulator